MNEDKKYTVEGPIVGTKPLGLPESKQEAAPLPKLVPPLPGQNFCMLGQVNMDYHAAPRAGTSLNEVLAPTYWRVIASQLKPGCEIRVIPEDNAWYAKLLVLSCDNDMSLMAVIYSSDLKLKSKMSIEDFEVRLTHNNTKHGVFRKADGVPVKQGFATEKQATEYLGDYVRAMAA